MELSSLASVFVASPMLTAGIPLAFTSTFSMKASVICQLSRTPKSFFPWVRAKSWVKRCPSRDRVAVT